MSLPSHAVTGATGQLGRLVASNLASAGRTQRLIVRAESVARAPRLVGAELASASYGDHDAAVAALQGVDVLLMVSASESVDRVAQHRTFIDAAVQAGVRHLVYTSFLGAAANATFTLARDHFATEEYVRKSGMTFTFLRDSLYLDFLPLLAGPDGVIRGPAGNGVVAAVARADVARVATTLLTSPDAHGGNTYNLTGREALSLTEVARIVTAATGKQTTFHDETIEAAYASRAHYGAPPWQVDAWVSTYTAIATGELAEINDNVRVLTGRPPITLRDYLANSPS
jgi:NAD(P)H dehydrogenase (quinone)